MKKFFKQKNKSDAGFTLVETLVAISIFIVSLVSLMTVLSSGITSTTYAKNKMIAGYLSQESVEYVRNIRDMYTLYPPSGQNGWNNFIQKLVTAGCDQANGCYFNDSNIFSSGMTTLSFTACPSTGCPVLKYNSANGRYNYSTGSNSVFTRTIKIECPPYSSTVPHVPDNNCQQIVGEMKIISDISWKEASGIYHATFSENLFNWIH